MIVDEARTWLGTPFQWGQSTKGAGCDCKGLLAGVARNCGRPEAESVEAICIDYGAGKFSSQRLRNGLMRLFDKVSEVEPGDVLLMVLKGSAQHLAICSEVADGRPVRMIHTYPGGPCAVIEARIGSLHKFDSFWRWRAG